MASVTKELDKLKDKNKRITEKWNDYLAKETFNKPLIHVSKYNWIDSIDHIWITFKSTKTPNQVQEFFEPEHPLVSFLRVICCMQNPDKDLIVFND